MDIETVLVCDGHNIAYRSFFAIRNLSRADGVPTNAVYGFVRQMESLLSKFEPSHMVVVFDGGIPQRRLELLESYKAQRPHMPEELSLQMDNIHRYLRAARVADVQVGGEEADDVIGTIAASAAERGAREVVIATTDKDMLQLVTDTVHVCSPTGQAQPLGPDAVFEKTGVHPIQLVEWLALVGDSADNIPGIAGVGPKTAATLLGRFGSLDRLYSRIDEIERDSLRDKLISGKQLVERNIGLMELDLSVPVDLEIDDLAVQPACVSKLLDFFEEMEFKRMVADLREPRLF